MAENVKVDGTKSSICRKRANKKMDLLGKKKEREEERKLLLSDFEIFIDLCIIVLLFYLWCSLLLYSSESRETFRFKKLS